MQGESNYVSWAGMCRGRVIMCPGRACAGGE